MERSKLKAEPLGKKQNKTKKNPSIREYAKTKREIFIQIWRIVGIKTALKIGDITNQDEIEQR